MKSVLVVDGDPRVCEAIHKELSKMSHAVYFAFDGVQAISQAHKCKPDLVIVDLSLPAGNGLSVVERLRAMTPFVRTPIIVIAERGARLQAGRVLDAGANAFLSKPLGRQRLLEQVANLLPREKPQDAWMDTMQLLTK